MFTLPLLVLVLALQAPVIPDVKLAVSFREGIEGEPLSKPVYVLEVVCRSGECGFTYVSLNDCSASGSGRRGFYPKFESGSTRNGDLKVSNEGGVLTLEQTGTDSVGNWTNTFRIEYEPTRDGSTATRVLNFSGGFVKVSELLRRPARIDYVPLEGPFQEVNLECPVFAPGIDPK